MNKEEIKELIATVDNLSKRLAHAELEISYRTMAEMLIMSILHDKLKLTEEEMKAHTDKIQQNITKVLLQNTNAISNRLN